ncbi:MAG: preprotein translocase subunit SecE [Anaerolineae bacterium]|nr:preprotein translocase subunit SecE [Anaerolineae bacterium]
MSAEVKRPNEDSFLYRLRRYLETTRAELRKVNWPGREEWTNLTLMVLAVVVVMSVLLGVIDAGFAALFRALLG